MGGISGAKRLKKDVPVIPAKSIVDDACGNPDSSFLPDIILLLLHYRLRRTRGFRKYNSVLRRLRRFFIEQYPKAFVDCSTAMAILLRRRLLEFVLAAVGSFY